MFNNRVWISFIAIIFIYWTSYYFVYDNKTFSQNMESKTIRYVINYLYLCINCFVGWYGWYKYEIKWINLIWVYTYLLAIIILPITGIIDYKLKLSNDIIRNMLSNTHLFLNTPVPYGILMFLAKKVKVKN